MKKSLFIYFLAVLSPVNASILTDPSSINSFATLIDFESHTVGTSGPISDGFATISSDSPDAQIQNMGFTQHTGIYEGNSFGFGIYNYSINFLDPVSQVGLGIFDINFADNFVKAYDLNGNLLETAQSIIDFAVGSPGGSHSAYVGFTHSNNDISKITIEGAEGDWLGVDNISYFQTPDASPVPIPAAVWLFASGLISLIRFKKLA